MDNYLGKEWFIRSFHLFLKILDRNRKIFLFYVREIIDNLGKKWFIRSFHLFLKILDRNRKIFLSKFYVREFYLFTKILLNDIK